MQIDQDSVPSTIEQAVDAIVAAVEPADRQVIIESSNPATQAHHGLGRYLRNNWSLWEADSPLKRDAVATYRIAHADDISALILDWACAKIRAESFDPMEACERFHRHWAALGKTSLEAGGWTGE